MKTNKFFKALFILGLFISGSLQAFAWDLPSKNNGIILGNIPGELINTGCKYSSDGICRNRQGKYGPFVTESFLKAGNDFTWSGPGSIVAENFMASGTTTSGAFQRGNAYFKKIFLPGKQGQLIFGLARAQVASPNNQGQNNIPVVGNDTSVKMLADAQFCNTQTMITTDTPAIQFWSTSTGSNATLNARGVQLSGGNPQPGMILISTDAQGNAVWATPVLNSDGTITFNHAASPVVAGQASCN